VASLTAEAARGILEIIDSTVLGAIRVVSVGRGHGPRDFVSAPFGGAGRTRGAGDRQADRWDDLAFVGANRRGAQAR
jgi:N-methylhydantoinase A/oxoprolinase/acetone carboxylase beta subunit